MTDRLLLHPDLRNDDSSGVSRNVYFKMEMHDPVTVKFHLESFGKHIGGFNLFTVCSDGLFFDGGVGKWADNVSNLEIIETSCPRSNLIIIGVDII